MCVLYALIAYYMGKKEKKVLYVKNTRCMRNHTVFVSEKCIDYAIEES